LVKYFSNKKKRVENLKFQLAFYFLY